MLIIVGERKGENSMLSLVRSEKFSLQHFVLIGLSREWAVMDIALSKNNSQFPMRKMN